MKKIIWDLFGGLNGSLELAIGNDNYEIYTFDILPKTKNGKDNIMLDLTSDNIIKKLKKYPKPDYITASPMCMSFSRASAMVGGSTGWVVNNDSSIKEREEKDFQDRSKNIMVRNGKEYWRYFYKISNLKAKIGRMAIDNTLAIINYFKPKYWYIENPANSLMWNYIKYNLKLLNIGHFNLAHYGAYNAPSKKPTIFLSNKKLNLKLVEKGYKSEITWENIKRKDRSDIPQLLLKEIIEKFDKGE